MGDEEQTSPPLPCSPNTPSPHPSAPSPFGRGLGAKGGCDSNENLVGRSVRPQVGHQWGSGTMVVFSPFPQLSDSGLDAELRRGSPGVAAPHCSGN
ncbi:unnamed protein product [Arctogadus glacialis]